jgi:hypothetical protein
VVAAVVAAEVTIDMRDDEDTAEVGSRSRKVPPGKGRCKIDPATSSSATPRTADGVELGDMYGGGAPADEEDVGASELKRQLALNPRIVGIPEEGQEEVAREAARIAKARREAPTDRAPSASPPMIPAATAPPFQPRWPWWPRPPRPPCQSAMTGVAARMAARARLAAEAVRVLRVIICLSHQSRPFAGSWA